MVQEKKDPFICIFACSCGPVSTDVQRNVCAIPRATQGQHTWSACNTFVGLHMAVHAHVHIHVAVHVFIYGHACVQTHIRTDTYAQRVFDNTVSSSSSKTLECSCNLIQQTAMKSQFCSQGSWDLQLHWGVSS